ncbi:MULTISPECIES: response regulator transcription factor [Paenibacillus]|uniref:response regulator transcription factor n=1 Tax=Paenibacillus TaxID=44249 RepID=UPI0022B8ECB2|nr:response regulator transcription factor [Paenibacillus caseinilyticus]MCZ8520945.1 response regulator transcription factor [Paenibacillus caseinilyticus]
MTRIVIAEDQRMLLDALAALLEMQEDFEIVGKAANGEEALALVEQLHPDVCILDIEMPVMSGIEAAERMKGGCKVVILTTFARAGYFERAVKAGVSAYLSKDNTSEELAAAIRSVMNGRRIYTKELEEDIYVEENPLTGREREVLVLVADGKSTKEIAGQLHLSGGTVRNYISGILEKLGVKNRIEAISRCREHGWLEPY